MKKLYTKIKKNRTDKVYDFILKNYNDYGFVDTFYDSECEQLECVLGKQRSLDAIYQICLSKFPNLTKDTYFKVIVKIIKTETTGGLYGRPTCKLLFCDTAHRWVFYRIRSGYSIGNLHMDELVYNYQSSINKLQYKGSGEICCQDLLDAVGVLGNNIENSNN